MNIDRHILIRYFSGECSDKEKEYIHQWLKSDKTHEKQFIRERIRFDASLIADEEKIISIPAAKRNLILNILKTAAAILILVGSSYLFSLYSTKQPEVVTQTIHVPTGNRISITLPDNTLVWLNSNTILKYPSVFSDKERIVELNGEAYFEVAANKQKAFIVKTDKYNVEVLGTAFNIDAYADKPFFSTALFMGKVKLYQKQEEDAIILSPGEVAELIDNRINISRIASEIYRWRDGLIIIEDKSFVEIMQLFEKYFGHEIIIQNTKVKDLGYHGKLRIADGIDHALRVLQNDFRFSYKRDEDMNRIYIY